MAVGATRKVLGWTNLLIAAALALVLWGGLSVVGTQHQFRAILDFSPQARFSLSPRTEALLDELAAADRTAEFFLLPLPPVGDADTPELQHLNRLRQQVQQYTVDLLQLLDARGAEAVRVEVVRFDEADRIRELSARYNLTRFGQLLVRVGERHEVLEITSDLAEWDEGNATVPGKRPLPRLAKYKGEEALSSTLKELLVTGRPKLYVLEGYGPSGLFGDSAGTGYSILFDTLRRDGMDVEPLRLQGDDVVPPDAAAILILEPRAPLSDRVADLLSDYVKQDGGRLFVNPVFQQPQDRNVTLDVLGSRFGFEVSPYLLCHVIDDPRTPNGMVGVPAVTALEITRMNGTHPVARSLANNGVAVILKDAREIRRADVVPPGVRPDPSVFMTSGRVWEERFGFDGGPDYRPPPGPVPETPRCVGMVVDVDPAEEGGDTGHVFVLSGNAFSNFFIPRNRELALSVFNWLAKRDVLVAIPGRTYETTTIQMSPPQVERATDLVAVWIPGGVVALAVLILWWRRR